MAISPFTFGQDPTSTQMGLRQNLTANQNAYQNIWSIVGNQDVRQFPPAQGPAYPMLAALLESLTQLARGFGGFAGQPVSTTPVDPYFTFTDYYPGSSLPNPQGPVEHPLRDRQVFDGGEHRDLRFQRAHAGRDVQKARGHQGNDVLAQEGGRGGDRQVIRGGQGNDFALIRGQEGEDRQLARGGQGNDEVIVRGGQGADHQVARGGRGDDVIRASGGLGSDTTRVRGGVGDDRIVYRAGQGEDQVRLSGGQGDHDVAVIRARDQAVTVVNEQGEVLFTQGEGGSVIKVDGFERVRVVGAQQQ